ncbi:MAG: hypothetical protein AAFO07_25950, partial [Bacteroidota bacterium]
AEYDKYGGWTGKKFKATGFFRVEKEDRWWFVSPEGNAFLSFGINHLSPIFFNQEFNYRQWQKKLGVKDIADLKEFHRALRHWFLQTCKDFGFNTVGPHNARPIINNPKPEMAYVEQVKFVDIPHWKPEVPDENFKDIFSQEFKNEADYLAKKMVENKKDDPYLLGYYMTDCPLFTDEDCRERTDTIGGARRTSRIGWPRKLRNLDGAAAGKEAYVKTMQKIYEGRISKFNEAYETRFGSFDDLANAINWRPDNDLSNGNEVRDNIEFLKVCVEKYYQVARNSIRKYDENHLFFGDKINANSNTVDTVLPITEKYTDVIMYQMYGKYEVQEPGLNRWQKVTDKPFFNGDSSYTMITEDMHRPYGPIADNLEQRAEWTKEFMEKAFARPNFIGWHYCGLVDATFKNPQKRKRQHSGLIDQYGNPYPLLQKNIKTFTGKMYALARK